jgi:DNA-directed RNA polymerase specialized sigma24 family protein
LRFVNGAGHAIVVEYPVIAKRTFSVQWKREVFNLSQKKLATLRAQYGWTNKELAEHCGVSLSTIMVYLYAIDRSVKGKKGKT